MLLDFWRALGIATGIFVSYSVVGFLVDPTGPYATVSVNLIMLAVSAVLLAVFTWLYFRRVKPSLRHGLELAAFLFVLFGILGFIAELAMPVTEHAPLPYETLFYVAGFVIGIGTPTLVGWWLAKRNKHAAS